MAVSRRIFISVPRDKSLTDQQRKLKWTIIDKIADLGYKTEMFGNEPARREVTAGKPWNITTVDAAMRRCIGAVVLGFPCMTGEEEAQASTDYNHYEAAVAHTLGLPLLVLAQQDIASTGIFSYGTGHLILHFPPGADQSWLESEVDDFPSFFQNWRDKLGERRDLFLGYAGTSAGVARNLKRFMEREVDATVLDWMVDFKSGGTILGQIQEAERRCSAGVFLFTKDDKLEGEAVQAAPRDNVVFEAGFFVHAKTEERVLIVREEGAKMPVDLGGNIYASLANRADISPIEIQVRAFIEQRL